MYGMYLEYDKPGFTEIKSQMESLNATKSNNSQIYLIRTNNQWFVFLVRFVLGMLEHIFGPHSFRQTIQYFMSSKYVHALNIIL